MSQEVFDEIRPLTETFSKAGKSLYLVGGIVRDLQLQAPIESLDFDLTTDARPLEIKELVGPIADAIWAQGERFGTIGCRIGNRPYEITTHRAESYGDGSRKPEVEFGDNIELDLSRRDFTINAMAIRVAQDASEAELIDPFDGARDLERRVLRTPIEPEVSFQDDPLRILRAARFIARYGLTVDDGVFAAATSLIDRMRIVSVERVRDEFDKLLATPAPSGGIDFLQSVGAWLYVAETVPEDELTQLGAELDRAAVDPSLRRVVVFSHVPASARAVQLESLRYSNTDARVMRRVLAGLDVIEHGEREFDGPTVRRLVDRVGYKSIPLLLDLIKVLDVTDREFPRVFRELEATEDLSDFSPSLDGEAVMEILSIPAGPEVGAALGVLRERRLEEGPIDRDGEISYLRGRYRRDR